MYFLQSAASESRRIDGALSDSNCRQRALSAISHRYWPTTDVVGHKWPTKYFFAYGDVYLHPKSSPPIPRRGLPVLPAEADEAGGRQATLVVALVSLAAIVASWKAGRPQGTPLQL